jgi:hypothetical protein
MLAKVIASEFLVCPSPLSSRKKHADFLPETPVREVPP